MVDDPELLQKIDIAKKQILHAIDDQIQTLTKDKQQLEGRIASTERSHELDQINQRITSLTQSKTEFLTDIEEAKRIRQQQHKTYEDAGFGGKK